MIELVMHMVAGSNPAQILLDCFLRCSNMSHNNLAAIAQLGERQTEDLKVPGSIPGGGIHFCTQDMCLLSSDGRAHDS